MEGDVIIDAPRVLSVVWPHSNQEKESWLINQLFISERILSKKSPLSCSDASAQQKERPLLMALRKTELIESGFSIHTRSVCTLLVVIVTYDPMKKARLTNRATSSDFCIDLRNQEWSSGSPRALQTCSNRTSSSSNFEAVISSPLGDCSLAPALNQFISSLIDCRSTRAQISNSLAIRSSQYFCPDRSGLGYIIQSETLPYSYFFLLFVFILQIIREMI